MLIFEANYQVLRFCFMHTEEKAATIIQRSFRLWKNRNFLKINRDITEESLQFFLNNESYAIFKNLKGTAEPKIPSYNNNYINKIKAAEWINAHPPELQDMAQIAIGHTRYIHFDKFIINLQKTIIEFNKKILELASDKQDYLLLVSPRGKSNIWIVSLALRFLSHAPKEIIRVSSYLDKEPSLDLKRALKRYPNAKMALYLDDAIYSGTQISEELSNVAYHVSQSNDELYQLLKSREFIFYIGAPYIFRNTDTYLRIHNISVKKIKNANLGLSKDLYEGICILPHVPMLPLEMQITNPEKFSILQNVKSKMNHSHLKKPWLFFDHKVADRFSVSPAISNGTCLDKENDETGEKIPFVSQTKFSYR